MLLSSHKVQAAKEQQQQQENLGHWVTTPHLQPSSSLMKKGSLPNIQDVSPHSLHRHLPLLNGYLRTDFLCPVYLRLQFLRLEDQSYDR